MILRLDDNLGLGWRYLDDGRGQDFGLGLGPRICCEFSHGQCRCFVVCFCIHVSASHISIDCLEETGLSVEIMLPGQDLPSLGYLQ